MHAEVSGTDGLDVNVFLEVGKACAGWITTLLKRHDVDMSSMEAILDFGCGCGRVIRHYQALGGPRLYGTDYNPQLVAWCRRNLPFAEFGVNGLHPPLTYANDTFDVACAFSVFTHLSESLQRSWLAELRRVIKRHGYLVLTTQGDAYAVVYLAAHERDQFSRGEMVIQENGKPGEGWYNAFHPVSYVRETLVEGFEVKEFVPGKVIDFERRLIGQDSYLLRSL
jgi:SAM-dependent methyltransferase